jgi:BirA family biotin operon repressor/biotin-[acetyl-CoA-carboxylase] ligase
MMPPEFVSALRRAGARLGLFEGRVAWHAVVRSTNDLVLDLAGRGVSQGAVVVADAQTAGRGRLGRSWHSPEGAGIYASVLLRPGAAESSVLTLAAGVAVADGIFAVTGLRPALKWPNDVWCGSRKLGGILAEAGSTPSSGPHVALGVGLNVLRSARPPDTLDQTTSLEDELEQTIDRGLILAECLAALATRYAQLSHDPSGVLAAWREAARPLLRRRVEWEQADGVAAGLAEDIDETGALLVRTPLGWERIISGAVRWT